AADWVSGRGRAEGPPHGAPGPGGSADSPREEGGSPARRRLGTGCRLGSDHPVPPGGDGRHPDDRVDSSGTAPFRTNTACDEPTKIPPFGGTSQSPGGVTCASV